MSPLDKLIAQKSAIILQIELAKVQQNIETATRLSLEAAKLEQEIAERLASEQLFDEAAINYVSAGSCFSFANRLQEARTNFQLAINATQDPAVQNTANSLLLSLRRTDLNLAGEFFPTYRSLNSHFYEDTFRCASDTVAALLNQSTTSEHPGMLLGRVQSGKTRTFISVLALAFDNAYDISIVLSKNSRALIEQTQKRLRSEFARFIDDGDMEVYDIMHAPTSFTAFELASKLIFVAKKQNDNLRRLIELFENDANMANKRVLIIDDEADNASIGYTKRAGLLEARSIATQISELRSVIHHSSFLQVTATPYSLYLQPSEIEVANVIEFKPTRPAFTKLVPVPPDYVGGETYFGESAKSENETVESLIHYTVDHSEFERLKKPDGRALKLDDVLTSNAIKGYRAAILNFIVGGCIQRMNGQSAGAKLKKLRYSFLLHSESTKDAHNWQEKLTRTVIEKLLSASTTNDSIFQTLIIDSYRDLKRSLELSGKSTPTIENVIDAVKTALMDEHITIAKVNSDDDVAALLDSSGQLKLRSPLNIFIGGQVLDRGVTLANLIGFYYGRRPNKFQQDTVLQHSRMYGYRKPDLPVTRFYTSRAIRFAMTQMEEFDDSLRSGISIDSSNAIQFIRKAEDGSIIPCSPNKILVATTQTIRPGKRILPIGFQTEFKTKISKTIEAIDKKVEQLCEFNSLSPTLVPLTTALEFLEIIEPTLLFPEDDAPPFDWSAARASLTHLSHQHPTIAERGKVLIWAARNRNSSRLASESSHATYIEAPDSDRTEGELSRKFATHHPILFLLRQEGSELRGWRGTPFYWPVIRAQVNARTAIYTSETID
ncbi:Z1 domain-containing protein [Oscillatoria laete-virens NRMC-F 0139]|nr:Z1 domain-containing protein [Oscillatoria laete-virens]MDL5052169.1 Z1 domain-containing protein [Oscillatoria laete-virens NRMC-F 0139]